MRENNVQRFREALLLSKAELARKSGLSTLTIDRVESGRPCRLDTKRKILLALGMKVSDKDRVFGPSPEEPAHLVEELARRAPQSPFEEVQQQNQELIRALEELGRREAQLLQLNRELEDTNRGVVALYAELDEKADYLRRASEMKSRFLSNMSHEFRTPLNSILSLANILLDHTDGELTAPGAGKPHPRGYGAFARKLAVYVRERQVVDLAAAVRSMTSLPSQVFGLAGRGSIRAGAFADLVLFDPERVADKATYTSPQEKAEGMVYVLVNGAIAIDNGTFTNATAGRAVR